MLMGEACAASCPATAPLVNRVWVEMNDRIINYIRGKSGRSSSSASPMCPFALMGQLCLRPAGGRGRLLVLIPISVPPR